MPRTFTLRRLLIGVTLFCVACGLAANFPQETIASVYLGSHFVPTVIVWLALSKVSRRPGWLSCCVLIGALVGFMFIALCLPISVGGLHRKNYLFEYLTIAIPPALGALALGWAELIDDTFS
jgi:hypothetical protein